MSRRLSIEAITISATIEWTSVAIASAVAIAATVAIASAVDGIVEATAIVATTEEGGLRLFNAHGEDDAQHQQGSNKHGRSRHVRILGVLEMNVLDGVVGAVYL